jgi:hypothetical protein
MKQRISRRWEPPPPFPLDPLLLPSTRLPFHGKLQAAFYDLLPSIFFLEKEVSCMASWGQARSIRDRAHAANQLVPSLLRILARARAGAAVIELGRSATDLLPHDSRTRRGCCWSINKQATSMQPALAGVPDD